jgi:hypothetical protein
MPETPVRRQNVRPESTQSLIDLTESTVHDSLARSFFLFALLRILFWLVFPQWVNTNKGKSITRLA